jgi:hypothetical protein
MTARPSSFSRTVLVLIDRQAQWTAHGTPGTDVSESALSPQYFSRTFDREQKVF